MNGLNRGGMIGPRASLTMSTDKTGIKARNRRIGVLVFAAVAIMIGLSFASVPLYRLFCQITGFGGTTQVSETAPDIVLTRTITVKFDAGTARDMPWNFRPDQRQVKIKIGQKVLASYSAENRLDQTVTGTAIYNVIPPKAGKYFHKIECFCFGEQTLEPGQKVSMPVLFFVDPALADDSYMDDVESITLSYTFFRAESAALDKAVEGFYNRPSDKGSNLQN